MTDKPMKVRIKMRGNDELKADYSDDLDDIGEITALRRYNRDDLKRRGRVLGLASLAILGIVAVLYFTLRGRESDTEQIATAEPSGGELAALTAEHEPPEKPAAPQGLSLQLRPAEGDPVEVVTAEPAEVDDKLSRTERPALAPEAPGTNTGGMKDSGGSLPDIQMSQTPQDAVSATEELPAGKPPQAELGEAPAENAPEPLADSSGTATKDHEAVSPEAAPLETAAGTRGPPGEQAAANAPSVSEVAGLEADVDTGADSFAPWVARALFTTAVEGKEPLDQVESIIRAEGKPLIRLYYYTELKNMQDERVTHRWEYQGEAVAEISFDVRGARWRVFSSKNLIPSMEGEWQVVVTDSQGQELVRDKIYYEGS